MNCYFLINGCCILAMLPHGADNIIQLPSNMCILINSDSVVDSQFKLIDRVYPDLLFRYSDCEWMAERAILAPKTLLLITSIH